MILNTQEAKKLKRSMTIDLRYINAKEYCEKVENKNLLIENMKKIISTAGIIWFVIVCFTGWGIFTPDTANASNIEQEHARFLAHFPEEKKIIGCYNDRTKTVREADRCLKGGDHNIKLPPRSQIVEWLKYFNEFQIINRLAIPNFESDFTETAENPFAKWYVQTLKSHNVAPDINNQLSWLKNRQAIHGKKFYHGKYWKIRGCGYYWDNHNYKDGFEAGEYWVLSCFYRYHYDANNGTWYAKRGVLTTKFYKNYMFWVKY